MLINAQLYVSTRSIRNYSRISDLGMREVRVWMGETGSDSTHARQGRF